MGEYARQDRAMLDDAGDEIMRQGSPSPKAIPLRRAHSVPANMSDWHCPRCTFVNDHKNSQCEMCRSKSPPTTSNNDNRLNRARSLPTKFPKNVNTPSREAAMVSYKCIIPNGVAYRNSKKMTDRIREKSKEGPRGGDVVTAVSVEGNWLKTIDGLWLPIVNLNDGKTFFMPAEMASYKCITLHPNGVAYRNSKKMTDRAISKRGPRRGDVVTAVWVEGDWLQTIDGLWLPTVNDGRKLFIPAEMVSYKCISSNPSGVCYRNSKDIDDRSEKCVRPNDVVTAVSVDGDWLKISDGLWLPMSIVKDGTTRTLFVPADSLNRRLAESPAPNRTKADARTHRSRPDYMTCTCAMSK